MKLHLAITIMALLIRGVFGDGVAEANKLISQPRKNDVEAMTVLALVAEDFNETGVT